MAYGKWGGVCRPANLALSRVFFFLTRLYLGARRWRNGSRSDGDAVPEGRCSTAGAQLREFIESGHNKLNLGGGNKSLNGFVNIDFREHSQVEREIVSDVLDLGFVPDASVAHIHSNHLIEHLTEAQLRCQMQQWKRILKPGGKITIRCPNALGAAYGFWFTPILECNRNEYLALGFPEEEDFTNPADTWMHRDVFGVLQWFFGDVGNPANQHLTLTTPTTVTNLLHDAGFDVLRISEPEAVNLVVVASKPA